MATRSTKDTEIKQKPVEMRAEDFSVSEQKSRELYHRRIFFGLFKFRYPYEFSNPGSAQSDDDRCRRLFADIVLAMGAVVCFLVFIYFLHRFGWTRLGHFIGWKVLILYYLFPASMSSLLFSALRLSVSYKIRLAIFGAGLVVFVYGIEASMDFSNAFIYASDTAIWDISGAPLEKKKAVAQLAKQFGSDFDTRDESEVVAYLRERGVDAVPFTMPDLFVAQPDQSLKSTFKANGSELFPIGRISHKTVVLCNESGRYVTYKSDKFGFNNHDESWNVDRLDIAALGQSFAQGFCVPSERNFVALIRRRYHATLNLAHSGEGPLVQLGAIKEYLEASKPKVVLWFHMEGTDLSDLQIEAKSPLLMRYLEEKFSQHLLHRQRQIDLALQTALETYLAKQRRSIRTNANREELVNSERLLAAVKLNSVRQKLGLVEGLEGGVGTALETANMNLFREILFQAKARVGAWGGLITFVYLPNWARYATHYPNAEKERLAVFGILHSLDIKFADVSPAFQSQADPLSLFPFRRFGHYNEAGHRLVAEEVLRSFTLNPVVFNQRAN